jgi:serine/threonine protein kinase
MAMGAEHATPLSHLAGQWLGSFQLHQLLGTGAMGAVYLAKDTILRRDVAIKLIPKGDDDSDTDRRERFLREARAAARLIHPHVVQIFQVGEADDVRFIAMEYVQGMTTRQAAKKTGGRLPEQFGIEKMREAADALALAESMGICHRDIKPANLLLTTQGALKIADFGLAAQVEGGESIGPGSGLQFEGTPFYMAPEQWSGGAVAPSADIYSLGCTFYHLLVGATPFLARDLVGYFHAHTQHPVPDPKAMMPDMDPLLADVLRRCMAKLPADRPGAREIVDLLDDMLVLRHSTVRGRASLLSGPSSSTTPAPERTASRTAGQSGASGASGATSSIHESRLGAQSYQEFFALKAYPFSDVRQPASFWKAGPYGAAVRTLAYQIRAGKRPAMLLGKPGSGRTFVAEMIRHQFEAMQMFPIEPQLLLGMRPMEILCRRLGVAVPASASQRTLIETFLKHALPADQPESSAAVVIDGLDADDPELLDELGAILDNTSPRSRLAILLVGPEDLPARLAAAQAPGSLYSAAEPVVLRPMNQAELTEYIDFRMIAIGGVSKGLGLDIAARQFLFARSGGIPKLVNVYCHNALTIAALKQEREVRLEALRLGMKSKSYLTPESARALLLG